MRLSRKAGLLATQVKWIKYRCSQKTVVDGYNIPDPELKASGTDTAFSQTGYTDYDVILSPDTGANYLFTWAGEEVTISPSNPGTVYVIPAGYGSGYVVMQKYTVDGNGNYTQYQYRVNTYSRVAYTVGAELGYVSAAEGTKPDAKNGYTYVTDSDGYTIMKDSDGNYYAYKQA